MDSESKAFLKSLADEAQLEQFEAEAKKLAILVRAYNRGLRDAGFGMIEALQLTVAFQQSILSGQGGKQS